MKVKYSVYSTDSEGHAHATFGLELERVQLPSLNNRYETTNAIYDRFSVTRKRQTFCLHTFSIYVLYKPITVVVRSMTGVLTSTTKRSWVPIPLEACVPTSLCGCYRPYPTIAVLRNVEHTFQGLGETFFRKAKSQTEWVITVRKTKEAVVLRCHGNVNTENPWTVLQCQRFCNVHITHSLKHYPPIM
jgi:hypothetical protein